MAQRGKPGGEPWRGALVAPVRSPSQLPLLEIFANIDLVGYRVFDRDGLGDVDPTVTVT